MPQCVGGDNGVYIIIAWYYCGIMYGIAWMLYYRWLCHWAAARTRPFMHVYFVSCARRLVTCDIWSVCLCYSVPVATSCTVQAIVIVIAIRSTYQVPGIMLWRKCKPRFGYYCCRYTRRADERARSWSRVGQLAKQSCYYFLPRLPSGGMIMMIMVNSDHDDDAISAISRRQSCARPSSDSRLCATWYKRGLLFGWGADFCPVFLETGSSSACQYLSLYYLTAHIRLSEIWCVIGWLWLTTVGRVRLDSVALRTSECVLEAAEAWHVLCTAVARKYEFWWNFDLNSLVRCFINRIFFKYVSYYSYGLYTNRCI